MPEVVALGTVTNTVVALEMVDHVVYVVVWAVMLLGADRDTAPAMLELSIGLVLAVSGQMVVLVVVGRVRNTVPVLSDIQAVDHEVNVVVEVGMPVVATAKLMDGDAAVEVVRLVVVPEALPALVTTEPGTGNGAVQL